MANPMIWGVLGAIALSAGVHASARTLIPRFTAFTRKVFNLCQCLCRATVLPAPRYSCRTYRLYEVDVDPHFAFVRSFDNIVPS